MVLVDDSEKFHVEAGLWKNVEVIVREDHKRFNDIDFDVSPDILIQETAYLHLFLIDECRNSDSTRVDSCHDSHI